MTSSKHNITRTEAYPRSDGSLRPMRTSDEIASDNLRRLKGIAPRAARHNLIWEKQPEVDADEEKVVEKAMMSGKVSGDQSVLELRSEKDRKTGSVRQDDGLSDGLKASLMELMVQFFKMGMFAQGRDASIELSTNLLDLMKKSFQASLDLL